MIGFVKGTLDFNPNKDKRKNMRRLLSIIAISTVLLSSPPAGAEPTGEEYYGLDVEWTERWSPLREGISGARALAMGRAFVAIAEGNAAYLYNPAGVAQDQVYSLAIDSEINLHGKSMAFSASVLDSVTSVVAAEMGYTYHGYDTFQFWRKDDLGWLGKLPLSTGTDYSEVEDPTDLSDVYYKNDQDAPGVRRMFGRFKKGRAHRHLPRLSIAGMISRYFLLGITGKYAYVQRPDRHTVNSGNMDLGILVKTGIGLQFGATAYNLIHTAYDLWPLRLAGGAAFVLKDELYITYDQVVAFDTFQERIPDDRRYHFFNGLKLGCRAGAEYVIMKMVPIRVGYELDQYMNEHYISAGSGYSDPVFKISAAYNQGIVDKRDRMIGISVSFEI